MKKAISLVCFLFLLLSSCQKQELQPVLPGTNESKDLSKTNHKAPAENDKSVRILYMIPADRSFNRDYNNAIKKAAGIIERWYRSQMGFGYASFPNTYLLDSDKEILLASGFFN